MDNNRDIEKIRESYKPEKVKFLFVGESPPKSSGFFYSCEDRCDLRSFTKEVFYEEHSMLLGDNVLSDNDEQFLSDFKRCECYFDDLCLEPVNHLKGKENNKLRKEIWYNYVDSLAKRIRKIKPEIIIIVPKMITKPVHEAIKISSFPIKKDFPIPFPAFSKKNINNYKKELGDIIRLHIVIPEQPNREN